MNNNVIEEILTCQSTQVMLFGSLKLSCKLSFVISENKF